MRLSFWCSIVVLSACGPSAALQFFPEQPPNVQFRQVVGASPDDLWVTAFESGSGTNLLFHGASVGSVKAVALPEELAATPYRAYGIVSAGRGRVALSWQVSGQLPRVGVLSADGRFEPIDVAPLLLGSRPSETELGVLGQGARFLLAVTTPNLIPAVTLVQRDGDALDELPDLPAGTTAVQPIHVIGDQVVVKAEVRQSSVLLVLRDGQWLSQPLGGCANIPLVLAPDDVWCQFDHWDGSSWTTTPRPGHEPVTLPFSAAVLARGKGQAWAVGFTSSGTRISGGTFSGQQEPKLEAFAYDVQRGRISEPRSLGVIQAECNTRTPCWDPAPHRLADGSVVFLFDRPNGSKSFGAVVFGSTAP